tara:strand:- start:5120 stop:5509 length:390 start_codon:yes stop_codon:yes gene_type:complete
MNAIYTATEYQAPLQKEILSIGYIKKINTVTVSGTTTDLELFPDYNRLIQQVEDHFSESGLLKCYFHFAAINTAITKVLFKLFRHLVNAQKEGYQIKIFWIIEEGDHELIDVGLDFKNLYDLDFQITVK